MTTIRVTGAIDRHEPDPSAPVDQTRAFIGAIAVEVEDQRFAAALIKIHTGTATGDRAWGPNVLQFRWIGDPPPAEITRTVGDYVRDLGPARQNYDRALVSQQETPAQPSYKVISRARAV